MTQNLKQKTKKFYPVFILLAFLFFLLVGISSAFSAEEIQKNEYNKKKDLRIVHISDTHIETSPKNVRQRLYANAEELLQDAVKQINQMKNIDIVLFSGDVVNKPTPQNYFLFTKIANGLNYFWLNAVGNHDTSALREFDKEKYLFFMNSHNRLYNFKNNYFSYKPKKGYAIISLDGGIDDRISANGYFSREQLEWLDVKLKKLKKNKVIILQHFPVVEPFRSVSHVTLNTKEYNAVINKHKNVIAILSGHYHCAKITEKDGILHVSTPALVEYPNAFRVITFKKIKDKKGKGVEIKLELVETGLKELREKSKSLSDFHVLADGKPSDRNTTVVIYDKKKPLIDLEESEEDETQEEEKED